MSTTPAGKTKPHGTIELRYERIAFGLLVFFVFLIPTKFGLINLDMPPTLFPPIPNFLSLTEQWPEEIGQVILILILLLWIMSAVSMKKIALRYSLSSVFLSAFIIIGSLSTIRSVAVHSSIIYLKSFIGCFILFHLILNLASNQQKQRMLLGSFVAGSALVGLIGLYQYFFGLEQLIQDVYRSIPQEQWGEYLARIERGRVFSTFTYPNSLAGFLLTAIPLTLAGTLIWKSWFRRSQLWKGIIYLLLTVVPVCISFLWTESKGAFLAFGVVALIGAFFAVKYLPKSFKPFFYSAIILIVILSVAFSFTAKGKNLINKGKYTFSERTEYWQAAMKMVPLRPVFGSGFFSFAPMYNKYRSPAANDTQTVHNNYLQILVETGFLGLICLTAFWAVVCFFAIRFLSRQIRADRKYVFSTILTGASFLGLIGFLLHNIVDFDLYIPGVALSGWFLAAIIMLNSESLREHAILFKKEYAASIILISATAVSMFAVFLTVKTLWGASHFYSGYLDWAEVEGSSDPRQSYDNGKIAEIENEFRKALWWDGSNHGYYGYLGDFYLRLGEIHRSNEYCEKAAELFARAISLDRYSPVYRAKYALAMQSSMELNKDSAQADSRKLLKLWREVIEYAPTASYYRIFYAEELRNAGKGNEAIEQYRIAQGLDPELKNALRKSEGRYNEARFKSAIQNLETLMKEQQ